MTDYLAQLKEQKEENTQLNERIESLQARIDAFGQELIEAQKQREQTEAEWEEKEQSFMEGIAKLQEESQAQIEEKNSRIEELSSSQLG